MLRRLATTSLAALAVALVLPACGSSASDSGPAATGAGTSATAPSGSAPARAKGGVGLKKIGEFESPIFVTGAPGYPQLLFVVERAGKIVVLDHGKRLAKPFLDISDQTTTDVERGLLSV
ncbi:MAG TPA: hypothetical protein VGI73_15195, partial [Solirubrobacterales bacterium]